LPLPNNEYLVKISFADSLVTLYDKTQEVDALRVDNIKDYRIKVGPE